MKPDKRISKMAKANQRSLERTARLLFPEPIFPQCYVRIRLRTQRHLQHRPNLLQSIPRPLDGRRRQNRAFYL